jgi:hypothetical protein
MADQLTHIVPRLNDAGEPVVILGIATDADGCTTFADIDLRPDLSRELGRRIAEAPAGQPFGVTLTGGRGGRIARLLLNGDGPAIAGDLARAADRAESLAY